MQGQRYLFASTQLTSAGAAFAAWAYLSFAAGSDFQESAIRALSIAAPVALAMTLGMAYLLPNAYRGTPESQRDRVGPWSVALQFCVAVNLAVAIVGVALTVLGAAPGHLTPGLTLTMASLLSAGVLCAQVGRATGRYRQALAGACAAPTPPLLFLLGYWLGWSPTTSNLSASIALAAACAVMHLSIRRGLPRPRSFSLAALRQPLARAAPLVPHLLCFGLIIQGIRITSWGDDPQELLLAHRLMLGASIGFTILASFNSLLSVALQTSDRRDYLQHLRLSLRQYLLVGLVAGTLVLGATSIVARQSGALEPEDRFLIPVSMLVVTSNIAFYYSLSSQLMRTAATLPIAASSIGSLAAFLLAVYALDGPSLLEQCLVYAAATTILPVTLIVATRLSRSLGPDGSLSLRAWTIYPLTAALSAAVLLF